MYFKVDFSIGCKDKLPDKMSSDKSCKNLGNNSCDNLSGNCKQKLGDAIGSTPNATKCKTALGNDAKKKVEKFCKVTCDECGKLISNEDLALEM